MNEPTTDKGRYVSNGRNGIVFVEPGWTLTKFGLQKQYSGSCDELRDTANEALSKGHSYSVFESGNMCFLTETKTPIDINKPKTDRELLLEILQEVKSNPTRELLSHLQREEYGI